MKVLIVEEEETSGTGVAAMLKSNGHASDRVELGDDVAQLARCYEYDAILIDLVSANHAGIRKLKQLRVARVNTPALVLSAEDTRENKFAAFSAGADDYLAKPYDTHELFLRMNAVVRRSCGFARSVIRVGRLGVDLDSRLASVGRTALNLTRKEYELLEALSLRRGKAVTKETLLACLYDSMDQPCDKVLDVYVCSLRKKLAAAGQCDGYIKTLWGRGYVLSDAPNPEAAAIDSAA